MNAKRNKNRSSSNASHANSSNSSKSSSRSQKTSTNERTVTPEGVYFNGRVMHVTTSLIGCVVQIEVKDGTKYEGVLRTFSPDFELVIDTVAKVEQSVSTTVSTNIGNLLASLKANNTVSPTVIFNYADVVKLTASNVDLDYATTKSHMLTDTEISRTDTRAVSRDRELVPWEAPPDICDGLEPLEDHGNQNGWDPDDMFKTNEEKFKVRSTYEPSLKEYTVPLAKGEGEDFELKQAQAEKIASEIEGDSSRTDRYAKEDADEEDRFSAVVRNVNDSGAQQHNRHSSRRKLNAQNSSFNANSGGGGSGPRGGGGGGGGGGGRQTQNSSSGSASSPPFHSSNKNTKQYSNNSSSSASSPSYQGGHNKPLPSSQHQPYREETQEPKPQYAGVAAASFGNNQNYSKPEPDETPPITPHLQPSGPSNQHPLPQRNHNENRRGVGSSKRKEDLSDLKKFSADFKLPSNENKENLKVDSHQKNTSSAKIKQNVEVVPSSNSTKEQTEPITDKDLSENKPVDVTPISSPGGTESDLAKKSTLNPNAKTFTPRSTITINASSTPPSVPSTPSSVSTGSSVQIAPQVPHHHHHHQQQQPQQPRFQNPLMQLQTQYNMIPQGLTLPLGPNQYLMTNVAMAPTFTQPNVNQQRSFRSKGPQQYPNHNVRHDFSQPSAHVAAATGHPVLATAPIAAPQQLPVTYTTQQAAGMVTPPGPPQAMYPHMYPGFHPRMIAPPGAAMGMMQHAVQYDPAQLQHLYATAGTVQLQHLVSQAHQHAVTNSGPHSAPSTPQSATPTTPLHGAPAPSPVHHQPNQPPTPTPQQAVMYTGVPSPHGPQPPTGVAPHSANSGGPYHHHAQQLLIIPSPQVPGPHHGSGHGGPLHPHALSHNTPGNHHGGPPPPQLMPLQIIPSNAAQGAIASFAPNPGV